MGSWNKTCGLSNLHITARTPVYVFMLEDRRDDSNCYTTSLFRPLLLPFESVYNDYGGGEDSKGIAFDLVIKSLKENLVEMPLGDSKYHDIEVTRDKMNEQLLFESINENRLFIYDEYRQKNTPVTFTMMRKDVVDTILSKRVITQYVGEGKGTTGWGNNYITETYADVLATVKPLVERLANAYNDESRYYILDTMHQYRREYLAAEWLDDNCYRYSGIVRHREVAHTLLKEGKLDDVVELFKTYILGMSVEAYMSAVRKTWIPGGHEGSQSAEHDEHLLLCNTIIDVINQEKDEIEQYEDEE